MHIHEDAMYSQGVSHSTQEGEYLLSRLLNWPYWPKVIFLFCAAILLFRRPDAALNPSFWAEDGTNFFVDARKLGMASLLESFTNYPMLFIRMAAYGCSFLPDVIVPAAYNSIAFLNHLAVIAYLFSYRVPLRWKPLLGLFSVLAPCLGNEALFNLTNSQWQSAQLLMLLIVSKDGISRGETSFDVALLFVLGLTGPFLVIFFPLLAARWWLRRTPSSALMLGLAIIPLLIQTWMVIFLPPYGVRQTFTLDPANPIWLGVFGDSIAGVIFMGLNAPLYLQNSIVMTALTFILYVILVWDGWRRKDAAQLALLYASVVVLLAASFYWRGHPDVVIRCSRYHYIQRVLFFWALVQSASQFDGPSLWLRTPLCILSGWALLAAIPGAQFVYTPLYSWPDASRLLNVKGDVVLPCLQPAWWVRVSNEKDSIGTLTRVELLRKDQVIVLGCSLGFKAADQLMLQKPLECTGITLRYRAKTQNGELGGLSVELGRPGQKKASFPIPLELIADGKVHEVTFHSGGAIAGWILTCSAELQKVEIEQIISLN